ncbi:MAG: nickel-dependent hydrogenase large subunit [Magnetococcales bacterium]|nr:nickel-dependent hydrogenase large subunit [Magnetococcales bacterium]NGZ26408.1 nickel-dependent hydrogenase large subunit [Magnetococcales bacterium]
MSQRIVVDPVTRIEGHLRIEAEMAGNTIREAYASGTMVRGIELILKGRDPRDAWAFTQRICGVCTLVHAMASIRAVEDALDYPIPPNAQLIRNLMIAAQYVHDHVMHFYHLHALDWVDVVSALSADPEKTAQLARSVGGSAKVSPAYFTDVAKRLKTFVSGGQLGIFQNGYWGHPAYRLPPEANLMAVAHYLEALVWQRDVVQIHTIFGGKNPHPNFVVGGVPCAIGVESHGQSGTAVDMNALAQVRSIIATMREFVENIYLPDTLAIAGFYKDWAGHGEGVGNFLSYGEFPGIDGKDLSGYAIPAGVILGRDLSQIHGVNLRDEKEIQEFIARSWYDYSNGKNQGRHPFQGETTFNYTGPQPPYEQLTVEQAYSWLKAPRWHGKVMEVGPLARVLMLYANHHPRAMDLVQMVLQRLDLPVTALFSTLGRTAARTLETLLIVELMSDWLDQLLANLNKGDFRTFNEAKWQPSQWPTECRGVGVMEAPRGGLAHWLVIREGRIANYQAVVPSTWNASPRDHQGQPGPYEAALKGLTVENVQQPIEILRTLHSFDPCIACAVHVMDPNLGEVLEVRVR